MLEEVTLERMVSKYALQTNLIYIWNSNTPQISIKPSQSIEVTELLTKSPVQLTGLGARDSLRLEAGMCLYGNDLDETTTPVEAGLSWVIGELITVVQLLAKYSLIL